MLSESESPRLRLATPIVALTAVLTTAYGVSPWLTLPLALLVSGIAAVLLGLVTVRLSGHYLPLGTIAWGIGLFYLFSKLEFLGRNDGISGIPPLAISSYQMLSPGAIYYAIWIAVLSCALLTMNLLDSRSGRAIRALRRGHVAAERSGGEHRRNGGEPAVGVVLALVEDRDGARPLEPAQRGVQRTERNPPKGTDDLAAALLELVAVARAVTQESEHGEFEHSVA